MEQIDLAQFLMRSIAKTPDKVFLQFKQQKITYEELYQRVAKAAAGLHELGIRKDDKVCVMLSNSPEYIDVWFGLSFLGAILVPLNIHLKGEGLQYILSHSDCKMIIVEQEFISQILPCLSMIQKDIKLVVQGHSELFTKEDGSEIPALKLEDILNIAHLQGPNPMISPISLNSILYTSGTTGVPKGAMLSHAAYIQAAQAFADHMIGARSEDILFTSLPLFHINAQVPTTLGGIYANATIALSKKFSASGFWDEIRFHGATVFNSLGSMIPILCKQPERADDRNNPARITACAATPKEFWKRFEERFGVKIVEGYGLTETAGFCVSNPIGANRPPSIGKPFSYVESKVVDEDGNRQQAGEMGEIWLRSLEDHAFMEGYYKMPNETEAVMKGGWFHSGDRGYEDEDGYLYFSDRLKQSIRRRGENISSWEIEKAVNDHPKVLESAAVGIPSEVGEEDVKIYIVLRPGETVAYEEILEWCEERLAYFMLPRYVQFIDSFPKTATKRVQKFKLKEEGIGSAWDREKAGYRMKRKG